MTESEPDPAEHEPAESARPSVGRRDAPDAIRPGADDEPDRTLPADEEPADPDSPDAPRPDAPSGRDAQR